jgi:hypothetical protein
VRQQILALRLANRYKLSIGKNGSHRKDGAPLLCSDLDGLSPLPRLVVEQALVMAKELEAAADSAPEGQVIDRCESLMLGFGRDFLRRMLESTIPLRAEGLEKTGPPPEPAGGAHRGRIRGARPRR